jgi:hypothetical protein
MKHLVLLAAAGLMLATAMPAFAAGSSDTDSLSPKNTPPPNTASSAPQDDSSSAPPDNTAPPDTTTPPPSDDGPTGDNVTARDPQSVLTALSNLGYPGKLEKMDSGRTSISVQISGLKTYIDFYDCADDLTDCYTLLFNVALDLKKGTTMDKANEWNSKQITGRVWLDDNMDPTLDFAFSTFKGVPADTFDQNVKLWDKKIGDLKDFFDF